MTESVKIVDEWTKSWKNLGWHSYEPMGDDYEAIYRHINVSMEGNWKMAYTYGMVCMKELSASIDFDCRFESLAIVYSMLKACDQRLVSLDRWGPLFCCPSGHQLKTLITQIVGSNDTAAIEWFTASVVDTGRQKLLSEGDKNSKFSDDLIRSEERIVEAVKKTFCRIDEGMFRTALVLHVWLTCGQKISIDDPAIILGAAHASMIHDALSLFRDLVEADDKSPASILKVSRAVYGQTILICVKLADIAMRSVCDTNFIWTAIDNFSSAHLLLNLTMKEYGVAEKMLAPILLAVDGTCIPQLNQTVVDYYCAVVRAASRYRKVDMPWIGYVRDSLKWLNEAYHIVSKVTMQPGRPTQIRGIMLSHHVRLSTPIGLDLLEVTAGSYLAFTSYYNSTITFPKHFDIRFVEAVAVLYAKLQNCSHMRDAGPKIPENAGTIPQDLIEKAWNAIASLTSCNEHRLKMMKDEFDRSCLLRSTDALRNIAKAAHEHYLQSDTDIVPSPYYSKYIELRLIDGFFVLSAMLVFLYETGKPEDVYSPIYRKLLESSLLNVEESSHIRRIVDDEGYGYWSCLSRDEKKAREIGRHRARMLRRQGLDEFSESGTSFAAAYYAKVEFRYDYTGLPGSATWAAFQHLKDLKLG